MEGNGQTELLECILGLHRPDEGVIALDDRDMVAVSTRARREMGLAYIPEDRHHDGLLLSAPLWENIALGHQTKPPASKGAWIDRESLRRILPRSSSGSMSAHPGSMLPRMRCREATSRS